eukprot:366505-Chlamydomonas_euryale.AAC.2
MRAVAWTQVQALGVVRVTPGAAHACSRATSAPLSTAPGSAPGVGGASTSVGGSSGAWSSAPTAQTSSPPADTSRRPRKHRGGGVSPAPVRTQLPLMAALRHVVRTEGILSLWRGNLATVLHRMPYSAVNFATYEIADDALAASAQLSAPSRRFVAGAAAGLLACVAVRVHACVCVHVCVQLCISKGGPRVGLRLKVWVQVDR